MTVLNTIFSLSMSSHRAALGILSIVTMLLVIAAACGGDATETPAPTSTPDSSTKLRPMSEWTIESPATREELEVELEKFRGDSLVFASWGGAFQDAQRQAYLLPFQEKFGIQITEDTAVRYAKVRGMAESGNITWHIADVGGDFFYGFQDAVEVLDASIIDRRGYIDMLKNAPYAGGGGVTWSNVIAYSTVSYPEEGSQPSTMADFFDTERFPGRRAWAYYPNPEMRFVLLAENTDLLNSPEGRDSLARLTDDQVERAFDLMEGHMGEVVKYWDNGTDCPELLISGELDMCVAWNGRIFDAQKEGAPIKICWECGHMISIDAFVVPKGLKEQDPDKFLLANLFLAWTGLPENNARISQFISYGPVNLDSLPYLEGPEYDDVRDELPTSAKNLEFALMEDVIWSGERFDQFLQRYIAMQ